MATDKQIGKASYLFRCGRLFNKDFKTFFNDNTLLNLEKKVENMSVIEASILIQDLLDEEDKPIDKRDYKKIINKLI